MYRYVDDFVQSTALMVTIIGTAATTVGLAVITLAALTLIISLLRIAHTKGHAPGPPSVSMTLFGMALGMMFAAGVTFD